MRKLYGPLVEPMARVIQGVPVSWDPSIAYIRFPGAIHTAAWSPCSKFIAVAHSESSDVIVLDAATLEQLHTMHAPEKSPWKLITFSPGSHLLTAYSWGQDCLVSWDLQTGGQLSNITLQPPFSCNSVSYSGCETMIGCLFSGGVVKIYNVLSGIHMFTHSISQSTVEAIWTCGQYLQFATVESSSVTIWQVNFTSSNAPTKVGSLSTPDDFSSKELVLLPSPSRFAFILDGEVILWDAQHQKALLHFADANGLSSLSFSPDGHFFLCGTQGREFYIWKESPTGYISHQKLVSCAYEPTPLISPDGQLVMSPSGYMLQLWSTTISPTSPPSLTIQASNSSDWIFVEFSPDESLVAVTERLGSTVTILDINSGDPWLVIDADTKICGLKLTGDKVIVVGNGKIITWDLPPRDCFFNIRRNINNSVQTTTFEHSANLGDLFASISPNLKYIAFGDGISVSEALSIYNMHTGEKLVVASSRMTVPGFTPEGNRVWCATDDGHIQQWEILEENGTNAIKLKGLDDDVEPLTGFPWHTPPGYQVTDDGWIFCSSGKWLLCLPHHLQQNAKIQRKCSEKCLAVWNGNSQEPCILRLEV